MSDYLTIDGAVTRPLRLDAAALRGLPADQLVADVTQLGAKRPGTAVRFAALLTQVGVDPQATYVTLHSQLDDFHASIPLSAVATRAVIIFAHGDADLPRSAGGPFRFFVPDHAACHLAEIDECANVKFLDRIELSLQKGEDNRPQDESDHAKLHQRQAPHAQDS